MKKKIVMIVLVCLLATSMFAVTKTQARTEIENFLSDSNAKYLKVIISMYGSETYCWYKSSEITGVLLDDDYLYIDVIEDDIVLNYINSISYSKTTGMLTIVLYME